MTAGEIRVVVRQLKDIAALIDRATPEDRRSIYDELGVNLTYYPDTQTVRAGAGAPRVLGVCVEGGT